MELIIDFDGTCVTHEYPFVGTDIGAVPVLKALVDNGHKLILSTMRGSKLLNSGTSGLDDAVNWFKDNDISLYGIQTNPTQRFWTDSPKAYGQLHIDDAALGCPLIYPSDGKRPYVDWMRVNSMLWDMGLFKFKPEVSPQEAFDKWKASGKICLVANPIPYNLFLDDERMPNDVYHYTMAESEQEGDDSNYSRYLAMMASKYEDNSQWVIVRSYDEFVSHITANGIPKFISFDSDILGFDKQKSIMTCLEWLGEVYHDHKIEKMFSWEIHSRDTEETINISTYLRELERKVDLIK